MGYRYLILLARQESLTGDSTTVSDEAVRSLGLRPCPSARSLRVFTDDRTPSIPTPNGGIAIGHVFGRDGHPLETFDHLDGVAGEAMHGLILDRCWGEYLLVQPLPDGAPGVQLLRDPSGGVACVFQVHDGAGFVTSDISLATALGLYSKRIDWDFLSQFLLYPNHRAGRTALVGIQELLPGCALTVRRDAVCATTAWSPWDYVAAPRRIRDPDEASRQVREAVSSAVSAWAGISRSVLLELSGGLDSSVVAGCLGSAGARVTCCTLTTPVPGADERDYAEAVARHLRFPLQSRELAFEDARIDFAPPPHSVVPCMTALQWATNERMEALGEAMHADSYFSGGGGDTVFCYLSSAAPAADAFHQRGLAGGIEAIRDLSTLHRCTFWKAARLALKKLSGPPRAPCLPDRSFLNPALADGAAPAHPWFDAPPGALNGDRERIASLAGTQMFRDGVPRGSKRWLRMPLLSQPVVEACLRVPSWMWIAGGLNRAVARAAFAGKLPRQVLERRSKGTFVSYSGAVFRRNKALIRDFLLSGHLRQRDLLDLTSLENALSGSTQSEEDPLHRILDLCMVENWVRHQV